MYFAIISQFLLSAILTLRGDGSFAQSLPDVAGSNNVGAVR